MLYMTVIPMLLRYSTYGYRSTGTYREPYLITLVRNVNNTIQNSMIYIYLLHAIDFCGNTHNACRALADLDEILQIVSRIARRHDHLQRRPKLLVRQAGGLLLLPLFRGPRRHGGCRRGQLGRNLGRVGNKNPPKKPQKKQKPPKKPTKNVFFWVF
jgi:hypothetical protein